MLHFLLDEHISPVVAREAAGKCPGIAIQAFQHWQAGRFLGSPDRVLLPEAIKAGLCLVTYDQKTIRPLVKEWAEQGFQHAGVVFVDVKTIPPQDLGGLVKALCRLWKSEHQADWTDRVVFLTRVEDQKWKLRKQKYKLNTEKLKPIALRRIEPVRLLKMKPL